MPIKGLTPRLPQAGRLRLGQRTTTAQGGTRPQVLEHFRVTSPSRDVVEVVAGLHGGEVAPWDNAGEEEFEVVIDAATLPVIVPLDLPDGFSQWYELWSQSGLARRCDGETYSAPVVKNDEVTFVDSPCNCTPATRECKPVSRLSVLLEGLPHLGLFRMDTGSIFAAMELPGAIQLLRVISANAFGRAMLSIERRRIKRRGQKTRSFRVPVLRAMGAVDGPALGAPSGTPLLGEIVDQPETARPAPPLTADSLGWSAQKFKLVCGDGEVTSDAKGRLLIAKLGGLYDKVVAAGASAEDLSEWLHANDSTSLREADLDALTALHNNALLTPEPEAANATNA